MPALASPLNHYRYLRGIDARVINEVARAGRALGFSLLEAAQALALPTEGTTLIFDGEEEMAALMDFYLHDYRPEGQSLVEKAFLPDLSSEEWQMLEAHRQSRASLFLATCAEEETGEVVLRDLLEEAETRITDIHLSASAANNGAVLLYTRTLTCHGVSMACGNFFAFPLARLDGLLKAYWARMERVPEIERATASYIFFHTWNRRIGCPQSCVEVL